MGVAEKTITKDADFQQSLYEKHQKIYPREVHGLFAALRALAGAGLLGLYYVLPWLQWDDRQIILFDIPARKFHVFGATFWPQDFLILAFLLLLAAFALFFFTALAGRLWCGYACPQTVWTELFLWIEKKVEGSVGKQKKLKASKWTIEKIIKKTTKYSLWFFISFFTGFTFVAYFTPAYELLSSTINLTLGPWEATWIGFFTVATYANAGFMREQVCKYMCPYARFQSAMFDNDTLTIAYDELRGDPRGQRRVSSDHRREGLGDCVDCKLCVQVCPTGIDIRDGLQYECIGCSACIDVCNGVMDTIGYSKGLIRYTTENAVTGNPSRILRPRIIIYIFLLVAITAITAFTIYQRSPLGLDVIRDRNQLYRDAGDMLENVFTLKVINMEERANTYRLEVEGIAGLTLVDKELIKVDAGSVADRPIRVRVYEDNLQERSTPFIFKLIAVGDEGATIPEADALSITAEARFLGPAP
ncbi:MAG: cytochrome c oxidase accessory protein CcoG [Gammaproteobacteria bacterium]|nr:MAG: cytochrome c oxidase accessory protein CcoG [Gammaproteobacteria bacterium]